ncbi:MAG: nucleotidyltransferase family protein [Acidobacteriota bacterium]
MNDVKAVILARGLATRMRHADADGALLPEQARVATAGLKSMIPVGDTAAGGARPFLDYVLSSLADAGYEDIGLVIGPEHDVIRDRYARIEKPRRVRLTWLIQAEPLGTANALLAAETWIADSPFIVANADNLYPVEVLRQLRHMKGPGLPAFERAALVRASNIPADRVASFALLDVDDGQNLRAIVEKPGFDILAKAGPHALVSMNVWRFDSKIFDACRDVPRSPRGEFELPMAVAVALTRGVQFLAFHAEGEVLDLSRQTDITDVSRRLVGRAVSV